MSDLADLTIAAAGAGLRSGAWTATELLEAVHKRATMTEADLHAYLTIDRSGAAKAAVAAESAFKRGEDLGPLHGIPIALKDNMATRGIETTASSRILSGWIPPYDATVVSRLKNAGAVIVGKTNLDEFAMGSSTENSAYGPTRNPWNPETVPGGSSGGSAAAVAAGSALGSLGSDTGGSIRQPASFCGVVGVKPTYGLVSRYGLIAFASSLDQIGPFTRTVEDAALMLGVISGHDPMDSTSYQGATPDVGSGLDAGVQGLRVGLISEMLGGEGYDPSVIAATRDIVAKLEAAGASVTEISMPSVDYALSAYYLIAPAECSANLARFDGVRYGLRISGTTTEDMMAKTRGDGFGPEVKRRILLGTYALSAGYYDAYYAQAQRVRTMVIEDFNRAYETVDVLMSPTAPTTAFRMGEKASDPLAMYLSDICTIPSNLSGHPGMSVPVGLDASGLPIGVQILAPALGEPVMFRVAAEVERHAAFADRARLATSVVPR